MIFRNSSFYLFIVSIKTEISQSCYQTHKYVLKIYREKLVIIKCKYHQKTMAFDIFVSHKSKSDIIS